MVSNMLDLLDPTAYSTPEGIASAIGVLEAMDAIDRQQLFTELFQHPHSLELALSSIPENSPLERWLTEDIFLIEATHYSQSLAASLLPRISMFLFSLSCNTPRELSQHVHYVNYVPTVLETLSKTVFPEALSPAREPSPPPASYFEDSAFSDEYSSSYASSDSESSSSQSYQLSINNFYSRGKGRGRGRGRFQDLTEIPRAPPKLDVQIQVKKTQNKKGGRQIASSKIDAKPFQAISVSVPETRQAAERLVSMIMGQLSCIIRFFLTTLRLPEVIEEIRTAAFPKIDTLVISADTVKLSVPSDAPVQQEVPSAFPVVQPMKAALYFDSADGFGEWRILISTRASRDLREARRSDSKTFKIIVKKIKELSNGHFSDDNQKRLNSTITDVPIYEAKMTRDRRLVYQVDCQPEYGENEEYRQVLRVFGIYTHAQLDGRFWDSMSHQLSRNGKEYRRRCNFRRAPVNTGDNVFLPETFGKPDERESDTSKDALNLPRAHLEEIHSLLVLEKFVTFSQALLNSLLADEEIAHVFAVSPNEKEIIEHKSSCYVLGRSGTGKTTTMLFKMLGLERAWEQRSRIGDPASQLLPKPRQIFVTQSRVLADKVQEYFSKLMESLATGEKDIHELARLAKMKQTQAKEEKEELVDVDDEVDWKNDLPGMFSLLRDEHFPLFITFDRLCLLLEADIRKDNVNIRANVVNPNDQLSRANGQLVTFSVFEESYWSHFPQTLTKGLDPSLVFSEFMGIIKGSEEALMSPNRVIESDIYENLSHRAKSTFATQRGVVYEVFRAYLKRKRERRDYDVADRTHDILANLQDSGVPGQKIDYLYVDEAQDNLLIDALLLRSISSNPDGLFWAGDTAQTISVGSSFRFDDLKSFLFRVELQRHERGLSVNQISDPPKTFQLCANFRSHGGIVNCAHSVVELITQMWPHAIDKLQPEKGIVDGLKPVFFSGFNRDTVRYESFLFGETGTHIEFGAQQCILVRDEKAQRKLREEVGDIGLILTLYESKGLEFNDVLLYNFFEDSAVDFAKWRVVLNGLPESERPKAPPPKFNANRHAAVCSELKFLYVAVTRARSVLQRQISDIADWEIRKNLWILDSSEKSEPMRELWSLLNMIDEHSPDSKLPQLAVVSTAQEWEKTGRSLFQHKRYLQAMHCFQRAEMPREMAASHAYFLREQARGTIVGPRKDDTKRLLAFIEAAAEFIQCAETANNSKAKRSYYRIAAECFVQGEDFRRAAKSYFNAEEFTLSASYYRKCGMFDEAVAVIKAHKSEMDAKEVESIVQHARLFYFRSEKLSQANDLFDSYEEALEYMEDYELDVARASLLEAMGKYSEAAELHLSEGRTLDAIKLFLKNQDDQSSLTLAKDTILMGLWRILSFGVTAAVAKMNPDLEPLLKITSRLKVGLLKPIERDEITMFHAIVSGDRAQLQSLTKIFSQAGPTPAALLCADHIFANTPRIHVASTALVVDFLETFILYSDLLGSAASIKNPPQSTAASKAFGFNRYSDTSVIVLPQTFFHDILVVRSRFETTPDGALIVPDHEFSTIFRRELFSQLSNRMRELEKICQISLAFTPCLHFTMTGQCNKSPCTYEHVSMANLTTDWYNQRIRIHFQLIIIIEMSLQSMGGDEPSRYRRLWLGRLYNAMSPPTYLLGTPSNFDKQRIPEFRRVGRIVVEWCRISLKGLKSPKEYLTGLLHFVTMLEGPRNLGYARIAPCIVSERPPLFMRQGTKQPVYIVDELLEVLDWKVLHLFQADAFLRHVIQKRLSIDMNALCTLIDRVCATIILTARYRANTIWHNITLPRSWLLMFCSKLKESRPEWNMTLVRSIVAVVTLLLEQLHSDPEYLSFENRPLQGYVTRTIFINRLCRALCLVGYNFPDTHLRGTIQQNIAALHKFDRKSNNPYITARRWEHLSRALRQSTGRSLLEELVQLYHTSKAKPVHILQGVRYIAHSSTEITPSLFASTLNPTAAPFIPKSITAAEADSSDDDEDTEPQVEEVVLEQNAAPDPEELAQSIVKARKREETAAVASEEQIQAARKLQKATRKMLETKRHNARLTGLALQHRMLFKDCLAESKSIEWPHGVHYRQLLLGPLPHILVCLAVSKDHCDTLKSKAKARFKKATNAELEEVGERMNILVALIKQITKLQKELGPKAQTHKDRDLTRLKACCADIEQVLADVPPGYPREIHQDLAIGLKGIIRVSAPANKKKPELCTDDLEI